MDEQFAMESMAALPDDALPESRIAGPDDLPEDVLPEAPDAPPEAPAVPPVPQPADLRCARRTFSRTGLGYFLILVIWYAAALPVIYVVGLKAPSVASSGWFLELISTVPLYLIAVPLSLLVFRRIPAAAPAQQRLSAGQLAIYFFIAYFLLQAGNLIGLLVTLPVELITGAAPADPIATLLSSSNVWVILLGVVLVAPFGEEFLMRKLLVDRVRRYGEVTAMLLSGAVFALFHGNLAQIFYAFPLGVFFAYLYLRTGRLRYTIGMHMLINFLGSVVPVLLSGGVFSSLTNLNPDSFASVFPALSLWVPLVILCALLYLGLFITGLVLFCLRWKRRCIRPAEEPLPRGKRFSTVCLNVGMLLFFVLSIAIAVVSLFA